MLAQLLNPQYTYVTYADRFLFLTLLFLKPEFQKTSTALHIWRQSPPWGERNLKDGPCIITVTPTT